MAGSSKIVLDADNGKVDQANKKSQAEFEKTAKKARTVGDEIGKWGGQLAAKTIGLGGILRTIHLIGQEATRQQEQAVAASRSRGGGALGRAGAIRELGLDRGPTGAAGIEGIFATGGGRATTSEQDDALLAALAAQQRTAKRKAKPQDIMRAIGAFGSGAFGQEELMGALEKGGLDQLIGQAGERLGSMSPVARQELEVRRVERRESGVAEEARRRSGIIGRVQAARSESREAMANPIMAGISELNRTQNPAALGGAVERGFMMGRDSAVLQEIARNTKNVPKPTMATTPETGP